MKKHEWRKSEKKYYLPKKWPELIEIPPFNFVTISGEGNPDEPSFADYISALYSLSYRIKMSLKRVQKPPKDYCDYTVYPLEGFWDIKESAKNEADFTFNKDDLVFKLMIRQPDFITKALFDEMLKLTQRKKKNPLLPLLQYETITDGLAVQMLHVGSFDNELESLKKMESFTKKQGLKRASKIHREIYLSDFRKVHNEQLRTVLRFKVV
ncbi:MULTISPECIES: GyrI-like domain-containing protein [Flavobacteriaceae]|uniref:GyrI-like domain-containing protein n=1 Tax=Flavobacteriaceae TaxID=49546 RepID=UPI001493036F|nr:MULTISPECIES: GyrI-like domain-containing protein [Allomuricauda]MDC6366847.1 GyrI-like domain-containing protein [Muricauda sp. AC10]